MLQQPISPLPPEAKFRGAGIYALYYVGEYAHYKPIAIANREEKWRRPIYVGKAIPKGGRKGGLAFDAPTGNVLYSRLAEHGRSIEESENLQLSDFFCRFLVVDDIWIPLGESLLISTFRPLWNMVLDGFGNHDPGGGRKDSQRSVWDMLHPGRSWASKYREGKAEAEILEMIGKHHKSRED